MKRRLTPSVILLKSTLLAIAVGLLPACSGLLDSAQPAKQYYLLQPLTDSALLHAVSLELNVVPGLDTDRIQGLAGDAALHRYENARWPDHLPEVLSSVMQRSLGTNQAGIDTPWKVEVEVQEFFGRMNGTGETHSVRVKMAGTLTCSDESHRLQLSATPGVRSQNLAAIVAAHQAGLDDVTRQLISEMENRCG